MRALSLEVNVPLADYADCGKVWLLVYGARLSGKRMYLDVNFLLPAYPGAERLLKYVPVGLPIVRTGLRW